MSGIVARLKHMVVEVIPTAVFFFLSFEVIAFTRDLILEQHGIVMFTMAVRAIGALVVAKVVVVVDMLPIMNRYLDKPLIYNVLWKAGLYLDRGNLYLPVIKVVFYSS